MVQLVLFCPGDLHLRLQGVAILLSQWGVGIRDKVSAYDSSTPSAFTCYTPHDTKQIGERHSSGGAVLGKSPRRWGRQGLLVDSEVAPDRALNYSEYVHSASRVTNIPSMAVSLPNLMSSCALTCE